MIASSLSLTNDISIFFMKKLPFMLKKLNYELFCLINSTPDSPKWIITFARFIANDMINIVLLISIIFLLWNYRVQAYSFRQHQLIIKLIIALIISLFTSWLLGFIFPYDRPFVNHIGYNPLYHIADRSFPSDHGTIILTFALAFLFWHRLYFGIILIINSLAIIWSRIYLGVHWPLDMVGSFLVGFISCLTIQVLWNFLD